METLEYYRIQIWTCLNNIFTFLFLKDYTKPTIQCPQVITRDLAGNKSYVFNVTETLLTSHSGDGRIMFKPAGPITLTAGSVIPIRANITKNNGLFKECAFLVNAICKYLLFFFQVQKRLNFHLNNSCKS